MTFRDPSLLWLLVLVPIVGGAFLWAWRRRLRAEAAFGTPVTLGTLIVGQSAGLRATHGLLFCLVIGALVIAVAGPRYGSHERILKQRGIDVVIALDFSKSMLAQDVRPSRIARAKAEIKTFIDQLGGDRVGVVAFAGDTMEFPMTTDYSSVGLFLRDLGPYDMPVGGTAIGRALVASKRLLDRATQRDEKGAATRDRIVILFTDGEDHEGDPVEAAKDLAAEGIRVYTVGIGSRVGEPVPTYAADGSWIGYLRDEDGKPVHTSLSAEAEDTLRKVAKTTSGKYFRAKEGGTGVDEIRAEMGRMKQAERKARKVTVHEERYLFALLPAFFLLVVESFLPEAWGVRARRRRRSAAAATAAEAT